MYYRLVGELRYYASWRSASCSRVRLVASAIDPDGTPTGRIEDDDPNAETVRAIIADIADGAVGQSKLMLRSSLLITVPGECWVAMITPKPTDDNAEDILELLKAGGTTEQWHVISNRQISASGREIKLKLSDGSTHVFDPEVDIMFRIWDENPEDPTQATSPVWSNEISLNEIVRASATIDNANKSRLLGNGMIITPNQMSLPSGNTPKAQRPNGEEPEGALPTFIGSSTQDLQDLIFDVATTAMNDPDSLAANLPIFVGVDAERAKDFQWIRPSSDVPETALKTRVAAISRLAVGLDVQPDRLLGTMGEANHWTRWLMADDDVRTHIVPPVELIVEAFNTNVIRPALVEAGIDPSKYLMWYDTTALTQDPDKSDEALDAHDRGAITSKALTARLGLDASEGYDLTTKEGWLELASDKIAADGANVAYYLPIVLNLLPGASAYLPEVPAVDPAPTAAPETINATPVESEPETEPADDNDPDPALNAAAYAVTRICVGRAMELAGKRRRTRQNTASYAGISVADSHIRLGPVAPAEVAELIAGWDVGVESSDLASIGFRSDRFRAMVHETAAYALVNACSWQFRDTDMRAALMNGAR